MSPRKKTAPKKQSTNPMQKGPPPIRIIKTEKCPSLSGKTTLSYGIGINQQQEIFLRILSSSKGGVVNPQWVAMADVVGHLITMPEFASLALSHFFKGRSANNAAFLLAVLAAEGVVIPSKIKERCFDLQDVRPFTEEMIALAAEEPEEQKPVRKRRPPQPKISNQTA